MMASGRPFQTSYSSRKGTAANTRQFDGRYDQAAGIRHVTEIVEIFVYVGLHENYFKKTQIAPVLC